MEARHIVLFITAHRVHLYHLTYYSSSTRLSSLFVVFPPLRLLSTMATATITQTQTLPQSTTGGAITLRGSADIVTEFFGQSHHLPSTILSVQHAFPSHLFPALLSVRCIGFSINRLALGGLSRPLSPFITTPLLTFPSCRDASCV
jgi:hypothetical protein